MDPVCTSLISWTTTTEKYAADSEYVLLPPTKKFAIDSGLCKKLAAALVTRYSPDNPLMKISIATASKYVPMSVHQWGQGHIRGGGDWFKCCGLLRGQRHARDCTYVKVSTAYPLIASFQLISRHKYKAEVDFYERQANRVPVMVEKTFFAELHRIICVNIPANNDLHLDEDEEVFFALVRTCKAEQNEYARWKYSSLGGFEFIDLATVKCTVGCIYDRDAWYIIDRSAQES